jgi:hypothetical protein
MSSRQEAFKFDQLYFDIRAEAVFNELLPMH